MEKKANFRIKIDLSMIFQDHRKTSWIFVDTSKTLIIRQLKDHISKIFDIQDQFYLLCDSTYLPCKEDVRIIQFDKLITLMPGSSVNIRNSVSTDDEKEVQNGNKDDDSNEDANTTVLSGNTMPETTTNNTMYHSMLEESEGGSPTESKETDSMTTEEYSFDTNTPAKRKRARRKRKTSISKMDNTPKESRAKPKIIDQIVLGTGKHIRFSNQDEEIVSPGGFSNASEFQSKLMESPISKNSSPSNLTTNLTALLNLKQCSTPLTFSCSKTKQIKPPPVIAEDMENLTESDRNIVSQNEKSFDLNNIDLKKCPPLLTSPLCEDIIAFKMFKMGDDYTPQISNDIFGRIIHLHQITKMYTIKILHGQQEIEEPKGKLSLPTEDEGNQTDLIKVNQGQLLETRLIFRKNRLNE